MIRPNMVLLASQMVSDARIYRLEPLLIFGGRSVADKLVEAGNSGWS
jgi:hypothetical protein